MPTSGSCLSGLISLEEVSASSSSSAWRIRRPVLSVLTPTRWHFALLQRATLRCFRRRVDRKLNRAPTRVVELDLQATLVAGRHGLIVTERGSGKTLRISVHASSSSSFVQWVTALYITRLEMSGRGLGTQEDGGGEKRAKRVTFNEETTPWEYTPVTTRRESVDLGELFYSRADLAGFRESHIKDLKAGSTKIPGRRIVHSLVSKLRRKAT